MHLEDALAADDVRVGDDDLPVEAAGTKKRRSALSTPMPRAAIPMKKMYGKTMRVRSTVSANFAES